MELSCMSSHLESARITQHEFFTLMLFWALLDLRPFIKDREQVAVHFSLMHIYLPFITVFV